MFLPESKWSEIFHRPAPPHKQLRQRENKAGAGSVNILIDIKQKQWQESLYSTVPVTS